MDYLYPGLHGLGHHGAEPGCFLPGAGELVALSWAQEHSVVCEEVVAQARADVAAVELLPLSGFRVCSRRWLA